MTLDVVLAVLTAAKMAAVLGQVPLRTICVPIHECYGERTFSAPNPILPSTCHCDVDCLSYDDCCVDTPYRGHPAKRRDVPCVQLVADYDIYAVVSCPRTWAASENVRQRCERNSVSMSDPYTKLPVTNPNTQVTYKNYYCALCNNDSQDTVVWTITLDCSSLSYYRYTLGRLTTDYLLKLLMFSEVRNQWGVMLPCDGKDEFYPCTMKFKPGPLEGKIRVCIPNLVSHCAPTWIGNKERQLCRAYMDALVDYRLRNKYRNPHCAICNFEDRFVVADHKYRCQLPALAFGGGQAPFSSLIDFLPTIDFERRSVGGKLCPDNQSLDPFSQTCRNTTCLPWETLVGGQCIEE